MTGLDLLKPEQRGLFIGGTWRDAGEGDVFDVVDPADGSVLTQVADGTVADAVEALARPNPAGPPRRRASAARSCAARSRRSTTGPTTSPS
jgi:succinate-semialdehyde dehydrogenase / glutarate-semialdehyde dehydrogenase